MIDEWTQKYDADIRDISLKYSELERERNRDLERLRTLKERYDKETSEQKADEDEKQKIKELELLVITEEQHKEHCIITIQRAWRYYKAIKAAKESLNPKKKKRGKGKKK